METTETTENFTPIPEPGIVLNFEAQTYLREAGKWAGFLGIIGFILCGFIVLAALFMSTIIGIITNVTSAASGYGNPMATGLMAGMTGIVMVVYLLIALVYFFFSLYLYQFGSRIKKGIVFTDPLHITSALGKLKSFFKLWGIITIVVLALYALILIIAVIAGVGAASMMHR